MSCHSQWGDPCSFPLGSCSNDSVCVCNYPAVAVGDFAVHNNEDCGLDLPIIRAFWTACAVIHFISWIVNALALVATPDAPLSERRSMFAVLFCNSCFILVGSLEGSATFAEQRAIGIDPAVTTFFIIGGSVYWIILEAQLYIRTRLNPFPMGFQKVKFLRYGHKMSLPIQTITSTIAFMIIYGMIADPKNAYSYAQVHFLLTGLLIVVVSLLMIFSMSIIIHDVKKALTSNTEHRQRLERVLFVFRNLRLTVVIGLIISFTISGAFGFSTKLLRKSPYVLSLLWTFVALPFIATGASSIAASQHQCILRNRVQVDKGSQFDNNQFTFARQLRALSTPKSSKIGMRRKQWKGGNLTRVDEGNHPNSTEDILAPRSE